MKKILLQTLTVFAIIVLASSCQYKWIVEPEPVPPDPEDTISFSQDIVPIWSEQGCTGCHNGSTSPDLRPENAYESITSMGLVDTADPVSSKIYWYPLPDGNHYAKYTSAQATLVLGWIDQGALDN